MIYPYYDLTQFRIEISEKDVKSMSAEYIQNKRDCQLWIDLLATQLDVRGMPTEADKEVSEDVY